MAYVPQQAPSGLDADGLRKFTEEQHRNIARAWTDVDASLDTLGSTKVAKAGDTMTGALNVPAGATGTQVPQVQEVVKKTGDTMTGSLTITGTTNGIELGSPAAAGSPYVDFHSAGTSNDYDVRLLASGGAAGTGQGTLGVTAVTTNFSGSIGSGAITSSGVITSTVHDGLRITVSSPNYARVSTTVSGVRNWTCGTAPSGVFVIADESAPATRLQIDTGGVVESFNGIKSVGYLGRQGLSGAYGGNWFDLYYAGSSQTQLWIDNTLMGLINVTSDYRIKTSVIDLPGMWETVKLLRPVKYTHRDFTPPSQEDKELIEPFVKGDKVERWGFIAHELQETLIEDAATGVKDAPDALQSPNPWTVIAALTRALQEAMERIEALERNSS